MKREIKFRGKTVNEGEWIESMTIAKGTIKSKRYDVFMEIDPVRNKWKGIISDTLGQFTGVYDKAGKEIYEDDILTQGERGYKVVFKNGSFWLINHYGTASYQVCKSDIEEYGFEVIGNIHDNPELINYGIEN